MYAGHENKWLLALCQMNLHPADYVDHWQEHLSASTGAPEF